LVVFREMVSAEAVVRGNEKTLGMTDLHPDERPLVQQLFGSDPDVMAEAAANIEAEHRPEGFDINMGCPVYKIVHNFNGAALMKEPTLATRIIQKMKAAISVPLSVKIRAGWSDPKECLEFCKVVEAAGADLITIHGRTKCQGYSDKSDWSVIKQVKEFQGLIPVTFSIWDGSGTERNGMKGLTRWRFLHLAGEELPLTFLKELVVGPLPGADPKRGRQLVTDMGCTSCHDLPDSPVANDVGPSLAHAGSIHRPEYLLESIKDPNAVIVPAPGYYDPVTFTSTMPSFGDQIPEQDYKDIAEYLRALQ
ncbi:MAG: tRNA-dihydrouridine synthase, partial [Deltaproteobacteria bacterium]|nr:tRNA-dihydrouridine synthase [Deltaproteobacteria bacterium]